MCTTITASGGRSRPTTSAAAMAVPPDPPSSSPSSRVDPPGGGEALGVGDRHHPVHHRGVVGGGPEVLADAFHQVGTSRPARVHRPVGVGPDDLDRGVVLLEVAADPGDGAAGPDAGHEVRHPAPRLLPDLGAGRVVLRLGVVGVVVLVGLPGQRHLAGQAVRDRVVGLGVLGRHRGRAHDDLGPVGAQQGDLLGPHLVGAHEDAVVAAARRHDGEPHPGVAARRLDDGAARGQLPRRARRRRSWPARCGPSTSRPG